MNSILSLICLLSLAYLVRCQYDAGQGSVSAALCTVDPNKPLRCQFSSICCSTVSECPINNCTGVTPFLCSDYVTCVRSAVDCNCQGVICSDGSCKSSFSFCPLLEGCTELFPKRCPDGSCQAYNSDCSNHTGNPCPAGLTKCIDGICRVAANCSGIPFAGCVASQCPNGSCTANYSNCLCPTDSSKAKCFDGSCTPLGVECANKAPAFVTPMNQTYTVNTASPSPITIQLATTTSTAPSNSLGTVTVPSNSVTPAIGGLSLVNVKGASSSIISTLTTVNPLTGAIAAANMASTAITISTITSQTALTGNASISLNVPSGIPAASLCVGLVNDTSNTIGCVPTTTTVTKRSSGLTNSLTTTFTQLGTYALIVRPTCQVDGNENPNVFCSRQNYFPMATGYYCAADGAKFYQCYGLNQGALLPCSQGTKCQCCSNTECSLGNTQSPCTFA